MQFLQKSHWSIHRQEAEQPDNEVLEELERMEGESVVHDNNDADVHDNNDSDVGDNDDAGVPDNDSGVRDIQGEVRNESVKTECNFISNCQSQIEIYGWRCIKWWQVHVDANKLNTLFVRLY